MLISLSLISARPLLFIIPFLFSILAGRQPGAQAQQELALLRQQTELRETELQQAHAEVARHRRLLAEAGGRLEQLGELEAAVAARDQRVQVLLGQISQLQHQLELAGPLSAGRDGSASDERRYRKVQRENEYLKQVVENNALLEEKLLSSEAQVKRLQAQLHAATLQEVANEDLAQLKHEWDQLRTLPGWLVFFTRAKKEQENKNKEEEEERGRRRTRIEDERRRRGRRRKEEKKKKKEKKKKRRRKEQAYRKTKERKRCVPHSIIYRSGMLV